MPWAAIRAVFLYVDPYSVTEIRFMIRAWAVESISDPKLRTAIHYLIPIAW
jgi:hypothetical protein